MTTYKYKWKHNTLKTLKTNSITKRNIHKKTKTNLYTNKLAVYGWIRQQKQEKLKLNLKQQSSHLQQLLTRVCIYHCVWTWYTIQHRIILTVLLVWLLRDFSYFSWHFRDYFRISWIFPGSRKSVNHDLQKSLRM